ncbi:MAG: amidohydrolase family protein, partial [Candidatus Thermoplasmatota archaeon]
MRDADLVLFDGDIHTMDSKKPRAKAIAFGGGRVLAVGSNAQAERWTGRGTRIVALRGRVVVPGFIDAHAHLMESVSRLSNLLLHRCHSREEVLDVLRDGVARAKPG